MRKRWTEEELERLAKYYPFKTKEELLKIFTGRSYESIQIKANRLNIRKVINVDPNEWTKKEEKVMIEHYPMISNDEMLKLLPNRTPNSIKAKSERMGLRKVYRKSREDWTNEDECIFIEMYPHLTNQELIEKHFPNRNNDQIENKAYKLDIKKTSKTKRRSYAIVGEKNAIAMKGRTFSAETIKLMSEVAIERYKHSPHPAKGAVRSLETRRLMSLNATAAGRWKGDKNPRYLNPLKGSRNGMWQGGITKINFKIRNSQEYKDWRQSVFARDNYTCQACDIKHEKIQAHHIENFATNEEKRFDIDNGITLCKMHHCPTVKGSFHSEYGLKDNTEGQLIKYIKEIQKLNNNT